MKNSLRHYRKKAGHTLESLAKASGFGQSTIGNIETGTTRASEEFWDKMAEVLRVDRDFLLRESPEDKPGRVTESSAAYAKKEISLEEKLEQMTRRAIRAEEKVEMMKELLRSLLERL